MRTHVIGLFLGIGIIYYAAVSTTNDNRTYLDYMSFVIVFGGSLSVSIMTNGLAKTYKICSLFFKVFSTTKYNNISITREIVELSKKYHYGNFSLKDVAPKQYHPFVMDGLRLLHNKFDQDKVKTIMVNMIKQRHESHERASSKLKSWRNIRRHLA